MIPVQDIKIVLTDKLSGHLNTQVGVMNSGGKFQSDTYIVYNFDESIGESRGTPIITEDNGIRTYRETVPMTVSFLCYSDDKNTSIRNALLTRDWFSSAGGQQLKDLDVVVVGFSSIENRDVQIDGQWERRVGFDMELRATNIYTEELITIEEANIKRSEISGG